ncbi:MAG: hypothetical protein IJL27_08065, partial [Firmicutes bacterium]|nr:hypothetical protein [Bacillota bacterium]
MGYSVSFIKNRRALRQYKRILKRLDKLIVSPEPISRKLYKDEAKALERQITDKLSRTPADVLKKYKTGARIQPISNMSVRSIDEMSESKLSEIKGVGPKSAKSIK